VPQLIWNHTCTVGVRAMDDQHSILMDTINELRLALNRGYGRERIAEKFDEMIEFMRMHFASEERLLEQIQFEGLAEHRVAHHKLLADMIHTAHQVQYGEGMMANRFFGAVRDSFLAHIEEFDKPYGPSLNRSGVQ